MALRCGGLFMTVLLGGCFNLFGPWTQHVDYELQVRSQLMDQSGSTVVVVAYSDGREPQTVEKITGADGLCRFRFAFEVSASMGHVMWSNGKLQRLEVKVTRDGFRERTWVVKAEDFIREDHDLRRSEGLDLYTR